jgi:hypothetical protein
MGYADYPEKYFLPNLTMRVKFTKSLNKFAFIMILELKLTVFYDTGGPRVCPQRQIVMRYTEIG